MQKIKYELYQSTKESGEVITIPKEIPWSEKNEENAWREAYGEPEIYDDGQPDPADTPSQLDVIEAQVTYTALVTDTLIMEV
jgi:hypothetical protein